MRLVLDKIEEVKAGSPKLKEFAGDLADTIKSTYSRVKSEVQNSGAGGSFKQGFLGQFGINTETVTETEAKKKKAQGTEGVGGSPTLEADKLSTPATPDSFSAQASAEKETEANEIRQTQLEKQTKTQEDITALYVISDDFFKETKEHQTKLIEKLDELIETTEAAGGGGGGTGIGLDDLIGRRGGATGAPKTGGGGTAGKVLKTAKTAAVTAAVVAGGGYVVDAAAGALGVGKDKEGNDLQVDEKQDSANWDKMSTFDKVQSGAARGIEKVGSFFFMDNLAREAQATRIKKETEILNAREGRSTATGAPPPGAPPGTPPSGPSSATGAAAPTSTTVETSGPGVTLDPEKKAKDPAYKKIFEEELKRSAGNRRMAEKFADQRYIKEGNKGAINPTAPGSAPVAPTTPTSSGLSNEQAAAARTTAAQTDPRRLDTQTASPGAVQTSIPGVERPVTSAPKTVEQLAMDEARKFGRSVPTLDDKRAAQMLYRKQAAGGVGEAQLSGVSTVPVAGRDPNATVPSRGPNAEYTREEATKEAARLNTLSLEKFNRESDAALAPKPKPELAAPATGGQLQQATTGVANAEADAAAASGGGSTNIVAPSNSTVVNNNQSAPSTKDTRNNESTFQRYLDRRYYPTAAR